MATYEVTFTRTEKGFVIVEADNSDKACELAYDAYCKGETVWGDEEISNYNAVKINKD